MGWHKTNFNHSALSVNVISFFPEYREKLCRQKKRTIKRKVQIVFYLVSCQKKRPFISKPPQREVKDMFKVTCSVARVRGYNLS